MQTVNLVKAAMREKAPRLYRSLLASGELNQYAKDLAAEISSAVVSRTKEIAEANGYSAALKSDPMKAVGTMNMAGVLAREEVFAQMLEFPQD